MYYSMIICIAFALVVLSITETVLSTSQLV